MFQDRHSRPPYDSTELAGFVAQASRQPTNAVAGYDLTFSPVKSVSALWALATKPVAAVIEAAHDAAVADVVGWLERRAAYTREGRGGIRHVDTRGLIAAAFTHRDSRAGDPDLHTHVAVSNKVQALDGRWLALDGTVLHRVGVAASERYNTRLEAQLRDRLGLRFAPRDDPAGRADRKREVREIASVDARLNAAWSTRRAAVDRRRAELAAQFQADHGRPPTPVEAVHLAQQATLETREHKHEPRAEADQRIAWRQQAEQVLGSAGAVNRMLAAALQLGPAALRPDPESVASWVRAAAMQAVETVEGSRAVWQEWHVRAEAERLARTAEVPLAELDSVVDSVTAHALQERSVRLDRPEDLGAAPAPEGMRRADGTSVYDTPGAALYTSAAVLGAEQALLVAAGQRDGASAPVEYVELALLESAAEGRPLNAGQAALVRELAVSGARLQLALAPAGSGKTTALRVLARAWSDAGGTVLGLAPSAAAAAVLRVELDPVAAGADSEQDRVTHADTLAKLVWHLDHLDHPAPSWVQNVGPGTLVIVDEAGMAGTRDLAVITAFTLDRGGSVRLVGDDRQLPAVPAGGALRDIARTHGAAALDHLVRFADPAEAAATLKVRAGDHAAIGFYLDRGRVHTATADTAADSAFTAWAADVDRGLDAVLLAPTRAMTSELNARAQARRLADRADPGTGVTLADGNAARAGDVIVTRLNRRDLPITAVDWVKNGDRWTITAVHGDRSVTARHYVTKRLVWLPADYTAMHVDLGYATTIHGAQGTTADAAHTVLTGTEDLQLLYVAATRGRLSNHIHLAMPATTGNEHQIEHRDAVAPPTPRDLLTRILDRDQAHTSATTAQRQLADPKTQLAAAKARYADALHYAAEQLDPGITARAEWPAVLDWFALHATDGRDPAVLLACTTPGAGATAAGLLDALDRDGTLPGPLPSLSTVPAVIADDDRWGPHLRARAQQLQQLRERADRFEDPHSRDETRWNDQIAVAIGDHNAAAIRADSAWPAVMQTLQHADTAAGAVLGQALRQPLPDQAGALELLYRVRALTPAPTTARHVSTAAAESRVHGRPSDAGSLVELRPDRHRTPTR